MPLFEMKGCGPCSLRMEWPSLINPKMPMAKPEESSPYRIVAIGEGPGENEDKLGIPFVGQSGQLLRENIPDEWKKKLYWQNIVRCRPPKNRAPLLEEMKCCSIYLEQDLSTLLPHAILGIGDVALNYFWEGSRISRVRGIPFPVKLTGGYTCWYFPIFHPSYVGRSYRKDEDGNVVNYVMPIFRSDIRKFFDRLPEFAARPAKIIPTNPVILYPQTREEVLSLYERLQEPYAIDLETHKLKPYLRDARILTAAFSDGELTFVFPVQWPGLLNQWGFDVFKEVMRKKKRWIAHNAAFEYCWIWFTTGEWRQEFEDTMCLGRIYYQRSSERSGILNLGDMTRINLGTDIKSLSPPGIARHPLKYPIEEVMKYNALDAWSTAVMFLMFTEFFPEDQIGNYRRLVETAKSTVGMEIAGLDVDLKESEKLQQALQAKKDVFDTQARAIPEVKQFETAKGKIFQLSSPMSIATVLTSYCGVQLPKTPETDQYITDEEVLEKLLALDPVPGRAEPWRQICQLTLDHREVKKQLSTYVEPILSQRVLGEDGRLHPSYTTCHTRTYRLSSEDPNIQNFPKRKHREIRKQIVAPPGFVIVSFDYGQLEARGLVMASGDKALRQAFLRDEDVHSKWLNRIIYYYPNYLDRLADKTGQTEEKAIRKAGRDIVKTDFVFASFYGSQASSVANRAMLPLSIAKELLREFWGEYRGIRAWIDGQFEFYEETGTIASLTNRIRNDVLPGNEKTNTPIQGTCAEIVFEAQVTLFYKGLTEDIHLLPRINVHDDLTFLFPEDSDLERRIEVTAKEIVKPRFSFINVPLMTEAKVGPNWFALEDIGKFKGAYYENGQLVS